MPGDPRARRRHAQHKRDSTFVAPRQRPFYEISLHDDVPAAHVVFGGGSRRWFRHYVLDPRLMEEGTTPRRAGARRVAGRRALVHRFSARGGGINSGHVLLVAPTGNWRYFASVHGAGRVDAAARLLAAMW